MENPFDHEQLKNSSMAFKGQAERLAVVFPELQWDLRRAGFEMDAVQYLSIGILITLISTGIMGGLVGFLIMTGMEINYYLGSAVVFIFACFTFFYVLFLPKTQVSKKGREIDKDLAYMLKDMQIQLTAGVPLFNSLDNIASGGYGLCSDICAEIVREVESGESMQDVLNDYGIITPSAYMRRTLWQVSNAIQTGSNVKDALSAISMELQRDKENQIESYGKELSLWGLIYLMLVIVAPSMGITLLLIMSTFMGGGAIESTTFWAVLGVLFVVQVFFIYFIKNKRPNI